MAIQYSIQKLVSNGTLSTVVLGVQYLERNDIYMRIGGEDVTQSGSSTGYTWYFVDNTTLKINPVVPTGVEVYIYRRTDTSNMYNIYSQNAQFDEATIDENNQQLLYIAQEYLEQGLPGTGVDTLEYVRDDDSFTYYRMRRTDGSYSEEFAVPSASSSTKVLTREALRRSYAEVGYNLVDGGFQSGFTLANSNDVALDESTAKVFSGQAGTYNAGTSTVGFYDRSAELLRQQTIGMNYSDLRSYTGESDSIYIYGRENVFDGAFGWFDHVPSDTTSVDDDGITLVGADGRRWRRRYVGAKVANWFGVNTSSTDIAVALQKAVNSGKSVLISDGVYNQIGDVVVDYTSMSFPWPGSDTGRRVSLKGQSHSSTIIKYTGTGVALNLLGSNPASMSQGINSSDDFGNFLMFNPNGPAGVGLRMKDRAFANYERMTFFKFKTGVVIDGSLSSTLKNIQAGDGEVGINFRSGGISLCNALIFEALRLQNNSKQGAIGTLGAGNKITGMTCEGNGTQGDLSTGGMILNLRGDNGYACLTIESSYFEGNKGIADLLLDNVSASPVTVKLTGCNFNRTSATKYTVNNIKLSSSGGGALTLLTESCAFSSLGSYVPDSPARLFVTVGNNCEWLDVGSRFNEVTSLGTSGLDRPYRSTSMNGYVNINGNAIYAPRGVAASRTSTGIYNVKQVQTGMRFAADINSYAVTISPKYDGVSPAFYNVNKVSEKEFNVRFFDHSGTLVNTDFDFVITANSL